MDEGLNYLQTFNPAVSKPELLEKTLIGRKSLVDLLEQLVIESAATGNKHQRLIIGPRGSGKTHIFKVLYNRISTNSEVKNKLTIAYLCEDEYGIANFLDFILRLFKAFLKWDPDTSRYLIDEIENLKNTPLQDQEKLAVHILLNHIKETTLLIIVENIADIFKGMTETGQGKLRDLIQQYPVFTIMASNQALFHDIQVEGKSFYNFFKITHIKKLTLEETIVFLKSIAEWEKSDELIQFINKPEGKGRIHAIYDVTGGNHRLLVTFYNFLKIDYKNKLSYSFIKAINDLIPYYQSFMNLLSAQQQKIIQYLCQIRKPSNVKDIALNCFAAQNTISKQLSTLIQLKYVDTNPSGKETYYELSEPLLRICFEVKENRGGPVRLFIDFLGSLYSAGEIKKKYMQYYLFSKIAENEESLCFSEEQRYYKETLKYYFPDEFKNKDIKKFEQVDKNVQIKSYIENLEKNREYHNIVKFTSLVQEKDKYLLLKEANAHIHTGEIVKAIKTAKGILKKNRNDTDALLILGNAYMKSEKYEKSKEYLTKVLEIDKDNIQALVNLGNNLLNQKRYAEAEKYLLQILEIDPKNTEILEKIGINSGNQSRHEDAYKYFSTLTKMRPDYSEGWRLLGLAFEYLNKLEKAKTNYLKAIELDENNFLAIERMGILLVNQEHINQASKYFKKLTILRPDYSEGWRLLGLVFNELNELEKAKTNFLKAIELDKTNTYAILGISRIYARRENLKKAEIYINEILTYRPENNILNSIGEIYRECNQFNKAISFYKQAIKLKSESHFPYFNIITCTVGLNNIPDSIKTLNNALNIATERKLSQEIIQCFEEIITTLFIHASQANISRFLDQAIPIIENYNYTEQFFTSIPPALFHLLIQHEEIELKRFEWIEDALNNLSEKHPSLIVPVKFLNIGIRQLKKNEKNVLFQFTKEERATFRKFVLDKIQLHKTQ